MKMQTPKTLLLAATCFLSVHAFAGDWPSWRGPEQNGFSRETDLPETWSPGGENLIWSKPYGARSAPVVFNNRVFLLNQAGDRSDKARIQERVMCLDADTGDVLWEHRFNVFLTDIVDQRVGWSNPAVDPETGYVYAHGVQGLLICLDQNGRVVWERSLTEELGRISGYGGRTHTPVIDEDRVVLSFLSSAWGPFGRGKHRYVAFDKRTGAIVWWSDPGGAPLDTTYSTPVVTVINGTRMLIAGCADGAVYALESRTGEKIWGFRLSKRGLNSSVVVRGHFVYASHSEENVDITAASRLVCIDGRGHGDVTKTHEVWRVEGLPAGYSSPALDAEGHLYVTDNSANIHCFDSLTGKQLWEHNVGTVMKSSPVVADGKIYIGAVSGTFSILKIQEGGCTETSEVAFETNDGRPIEINGAPSVANGRIYFATKTALYCIGKKDRKPAPVPTPVPPLPAESPPSPLAKPAHLQITPAEVALTPGASRVFTARLFDAGGRLLRECRPTWSVKGLVAQVNENGKLVIPRDSDFQGGMLTAKFQDLEASARVRVVKNMPFEVDFESVAGKVPPGWVGATPVKWQVVQEEGGNRVFKKLANNPKFLDAEVYLGLPTWKNYTVQADVRVTEARRQMPNPGLIANRYFLVLLGNHQRLRLVSWVPMPRVEKQVKLRWNPNTWYRMKLRIDPQGTNALVRGKVWERGKAEPSAWTVELVDPSPNLTGSPGLHAYSAGTTERRTGGEVFFDNIKVTNK